MTGKAASLPRPAVGGVVFKDNCVLLIRRANPPARGLWSIPGGKVEPGESLAQAVEREVREETSIKVKAEQAIYVFDIIDKDEQQNIRFHYVIVDFLATYVSGKPSPQDDALEARWFTMEELQNKQVYPKTKELVLNIYNKQYKELL